jgi:hypothetical protein
MFFRNVGTYLPNIYGVISQKTVLLKSWRLIKNKGS